MRVLIILTLILNHFSYGQKCSDDSLFNRFKKDIQFELIRYKQVEWDDETRESYYTLMHSCPISSLAKYAADSIPAIRCLIFIGLAQKNADSDFLTQILSKHKDDTAEYVDSPTDVVVSWTVKDFMQTALKWKIDKKIPNEGGDYESRLKAIRDIVKIKIPGEYHGTISKDSLLAIDSLTYPLKEYKISSFSLVNAGTMKKLSTNNTFTPEIKELIKAMELGEVVVIEDIIVENSKKVRRKAPTMIFELK